MNRFPERHVILPLDQKHHEGGDDNVDQQLRNQQHDGFLHNIRPGRVRVHQAACSDSDRELQHDHRDDGQKGNEHDIPDVPHRIFHWRSGSLRQVLKENGIWRAHRRGSALGTHHGLWFKLRIVGR